MPHNCVLQGPFLLVMVSTCTLVNTLAFSASHVPIVTGLRLVADASGLRDAGCLDVLLGMWLRFEQ